MENLQQQAQQHDNRLVFINDQFKLILDYYKTLETKERKQGFLQEVESQLKNRLYSHFTDKFNLLQLSPVDIKDNFLTIIEDKLDKEVRKEFLPLDKQDQLFLEVMKLSMDFLAILPAQKEKIEYRLEEIVPMYEAGEYEDPSTGEMIKFTSQQISDLKKEIEMHKEFILKASKYVIKGDA